MLKLRTDDLQQSLGQTPPVNDVAHATLDRHELFNIITHASGIVLSVIGTMVLFRIVLPTADPWRIVGCAIFAATLIGVYTASTLSHYVLEPSGRAFFRKLDQALIYLLIAGSYTPFALEYLRTSWWWLLFGVMWSLALWGFASKMFIPRQSELVLLRKYLILGWLPILPAFQYSHYMPMGALAWVLAGGLYYSVGAVFFFLDYKRYYFHALWHTLVIAGSTCHYFGVLIYVACAP